LTYRKTIIVIKKLLKTSIKSRKIRN